MKGILHKGELWKLKDKWVVRALRPNPAHPFEYPIHPDDEQCCLEGKEVEFGILKEGIEYGFPDGSIFEPAYDMAKLILPTTESSWDDIFKDYMIENYPPFGAPFVDAESLEDYLKRKFNPPTPLKQ